MAVLLLLAGCDETCELPDAAAPDVQACPGQTPVTTIDPAEPLFGEPCEQPPFPQIGGCRPDPKVVGGYAGVCIDGRCRPVCGTFDNGVSREQCCLRGGVERPDGRGACGCAPD